MSADRIGSRAPLSDDGTRANRRRLPLIFLAIGAVTVGSTLLMYWLGLRVAAANRAVAGQREVLENLAGTISTLKDAETGQRGFLLTGDAAYLEPRDTAVAQIEHHLGDLEQWAATNPAVTAAAAAVKRLTHEMLADLEESIRVRREQGPEAALQLVRTKPSKRTMDELRKQITGLETVARDALAEAQRQRDQATRVRTTMAAVLAVVELAFLWWAFRQIRRAMAAVAHRRELLAVTLASIGDGVIVTDTAGLVRFLNSEAERLTGWTRAAAVGQPLSAVFRIINESTRAPVENPAEKVLRLGAVVGLANHTLLIARDGREVPIDDSGAPIRQADGQVDGVVLVFRDFTARRHAERALRLAKEDWEQTFHGVPDLLAILDDQHRVVRVNDALAKRLGHTPDECIGLRCYEAMHGTSEPPAYCPHALTCRDGQEHVTEVHEPRLDGDFLVSTTPRFDGQGRVVGSIHVARDITALKRAEDEIRSLARFPEENPNPVLRADQAGQVLYANRAARAMLAQMDWQTGQPLPAALLAHVQQVLSSGQNMEVDLGCPRGMVWSFGLSPGGGAGCVNLYARDVTARREAEAALARAFEQRRLSLEAADLGAWDYRFDAGDVFWDERCRNMWGIAEGGQTTYEQAIEAIHPEDRAGVGAAVQAALAGVEDGAYHREFRVVWPDDSIHWIASHGRVYFESAGGHRRPVRFIGANREITEQKLAEAALRDSERWLRMAQEAANAGTWEWNLQTNENIWSQNTWRLYGLDPARGAPSYEAWRQAIHADDRAGVERAVQEAARCGSELEVEWRVVTRDGSERWLMSRGQPVRDADGKPVRYIGVVLDITERKRVEQDLSAAKISAERAKSVAEAATRAKDHFLAVLSHELRTPLTPVLATAAMLKDDQRLAAEVRESVEVIHRNAELEARLIDDLLDLTRIARGRVELNRTRLELRTIIERAIEVCRPDIEARRLHFGADLAGGAEAVHADPARLQQVFWNLLKNAIKFTPVGGCVGLRCWRENEHLVTEVQDSGIGIAPHTLTRIFNAFEQGAQAHAHRFGGLGLGLAISKALVELHGGTIGAASAGEGKGATFTVQLPMAEVRGARVEGPRAAAAAGAAPATAAGGLRILLVEDHGDTARIIARLLASAGHEVRTAGDLATAQAEAAQGSFDLLISDLGLPDGSGLDLLRALRANGYGFPAIALTGYGQEEDVHRTRQAGFATHLTKPIDFAQLERAIGAIQSKGG